MKASCFLSIYLSTYISIYLSTQDQEARAEHEAKMAKIASIEEAKQRDRLLEENSEEGDTFVQKLTAKIFENLQVTVRNNNQSINQ